MCLTPPPMGIIYSLCAASSPNPTLSRGKGSGILQSFFGCSLWEHGVWGRDYIVFVQSSTASGHYLEFAYGFWMNVDNVPCVVQPSIYRNGIHFLPQHATQNSEISCTSNARLTQSSLFLPVYLSLYLFLSLTQTIASHHILSSRSSQKYMYMSVQKVSDLEVNYLVHSWSKMQLSSATQDCCENTDIYMLDNMHVYITPHQSDRNLVHVVTVLCRQTRDDIR